MPCCTRFFLSLAALSTAPACAQETTALQPVVVTAQGREQNPQAVPLTLDVVGAERLDASERGAARFTLLRKSGGSLQ